MTLSRRRAILEALFWSAGLALVAFADPRSGFLPSVCLFDRIGDWVGVAFCPGCGLGRSVGYLARGEFAASWSMHPLAVPAVTILVHHVVRLLRDGPGRRGIGPVGRHGETLHV